MNIFLLMKKLVYYVPIICIFAMVAEKNRQTNSLHIKKKKKKKKQSVQNNIRLYIYTCIQFTRVLLLIIVIKKLNDVLEGLSFKFD